MKTILSAVLLFFTATSFTQDYDDIIINPFWSFYSPNYLDAVSSGRGGTGIGAVGSNLSSSYLNPASMNITGEYQADIQYTYKSKQEWLPQLVSDMNLKQNPFSGSVGFGMKFSKDFQAAILYGNPNSFTLDLGEIVVTDEFGNEIGRYQAYEKYIAHSFSAPIVYNVGMLRVGLTLNYSFHRRIANFSNDEFTGKFDRFNIQGGIIVQPVKELTLGLTFTPEATGRVEGSSNAVASEYTTATIPLKFGGGFQYLFNGSKLKLAGDLTYSKSSSRKGLKDQLSFHGGLEYTANKRLTIRAGAFNLQDPRELNSTTVTYLNPNDSYSQVFLTIGATVKTKKADFSIGIMDSHISSGVIKLLLVNAGASINF